MLCGSAPAEPPATAPGPVVLVGLPGLRAADLTVGGTPVLWGLQATGAAGSLSVRTARATTCPADGWLTLNAAARAGMPAPTGGVPAPVNVPEPAASCPFPVVTPTAAGGGRIGSFGAIVAANRTYRFGAHFGLLARSAGRIGCGTAVGPGAALALADETGAVASYRPDPATVDAEILARCPLTVVDLGGLPLNGRRDALGRADTTLGRLHEALPPRATLMVAGLADDGAPARLRLVLATGPRLGPGRLDAPSTRQPGLVQLTDLTPSVLDLLGAEPDGRVDGSVVSVSPAADPGLRGRAVAADVQRVALVPFFITLSLALLGLVALLTVTGPRRRLAAAAQVLAAIPVATFLANLAPWWTVGQPAVALAALVAGIAVGLAAVAGLGPWRRHPWGPSTVLAATTAIVLAVDVVTGSRLQMTALYGHSPLLAGRFYGFNNSTFAVFAVATILLAAGLAHRDVERGRTRHAAWTVAGIGAVAVVVDGWPTWGADFGGVLALVPAFALLALATGGVRLTAGRVALAGGAAVLAVALVATLDWLRPARSRSHLGAFVQRVVDGDAGQILARKVAQNLHTFTDQPWALLVPVAIGCVVVLLVRPERVRAERLSTAYARLPTLRSGLLAATGAAVLGLVVNDSGATVPAMALTLGVPLAVATLLGSRPAGARSADQPSASQRTASARAT